MKIVSPVLPTHQLELLPVRVSSQCLRDKTISHMHNHTQLCYVRSGTLRHTISGRTYIQQPDSCSIILPYTEHAIDLTESADTPVVTFISFFDTFMTQNGYRFFPYGKELSFFENYSMPQLYSFQNNEAKRARSLVLNMTNEFHKNNADSYRKIADLVAELFIMLCTTKRSSKNNEISSSQIKGIKEALTYVDANYAKKLTIEDLCSVSGMSRSTFTSNFKLVTGLTFSQYLLSRRLSAVHDLLLRKHHSKIVLDNVAKLCGLGDRTNLTRVFTKHFGVSPSQFCINIFTAPGRESRCEAFEYISSSEQTP